jgi:hypothetical protein
VRAFCFGAGKGAARSFVSFGRYKTLLVYSGSGDMLLGVLDVACDDGHAL